MSDYRGLELPSAPLFERVARELFFLSAGQARSSRGIF